MRMCLFFWISIVVQAVESGLRESLNTRCAIYRLDCKSRLLCVLCQYKLLWLMWDDMMDRVFGVVGTFFMIIAFMLSFVFLGSAAFGECEEQLDIALVLDVSGSMSGNCVPGSKKIDCLKDGTKTIIDSADMDGSRVAIFIFAGIQKKVVDFTPVLGNRVLLKSYADSLSAGGSTSLGDGLKAGLEYLNSSVGDGRKGIVILFTDGKVNTGSLSTSSSIENYVYDNWHDGPFEIYTMGVGKNVNKNMLEKIAADTHGRFYNVTDTCNGNCIANLFLDAVGHAKSGFRVSYIFTSCNDAINKTIRFDACATNISDYVPSARNITNITIVDSVNKNLSYVANTGAITYINATGRVTYPENPDENVFGDRRIIRFNISNVTENMTVLTRFGLVNSTGDFDAVSGTMNNATVYYNINGSKYSIDGNDTFLFFCGCPPFVSECDGVNIADNPNCAQDTSMCDIIGNLRKFGKRDVFGNCTLKPGCYCIEDPWNWTTDYDYSVDACECITGRNDYWDYGRVECCNLGDCWISSDRIWICDDGIRNDGGEFCEVLSACGEEWYWNKTVWADKLPLGCECGISDDCENNNCIVGLCLNPVNPNITFSSDSVTADLGSEVQIVILVKNNLAVKDTIKIRLYANPEKVLHWSMFENGENEITVALDEGEEILIPIDVFAGEIGTYKIMIYANSELIPSLDAKDVQHFQVVHRNQGITSRTPGVGWSGVVLIVAICGMLVGRRV